MKKLLIFTLFVLVFTLASCHGQLKPESDQKPSIEYEVPESFDTTKEYNITFWAKNDSNLSQKTIYENTVTKFQELYPNIHVTMVQYYDYQTIYNDVITNIPTKTTPNVCIAYPDHVATYLTGNDIVVPLDSFMDNAKYGFGGTELLYDAPTKEEVITKFLDEGKLDGTSYTLPFMRSSEACYVNKTLLNELGFEMPEVLTWDFVWEVCEKAKQVHTEKGFIPFVYKSTDNMLIQMLAQKNMNYTDSEGNVYLFNSETKKLISQLQEYGSKGYFDTFKRVSYPSTFFNTGNCVFAIDSTAGATWLGSHASNADAGLNVVEFETVVKTIPQEDVNNQKMISQGPSICLFNKEDKQTVLASWIFAQFLLTEYPQVNYSKTEGYIPVTTKAINSEKYQDYLSRRGENNYVYYSVKIDAAKIVIDHINDTFITPAFNGSASVRNAAGQLIESSFEAKYKGEDKMDQLFEDTISLYKLNETTNIITDQPTNTNANTSLPKEAVVLITTLVVVWVLLGTYVIVDFVKKKSKKK